ncbi:heterodisulfide reductase-related iron-sulfur binding cluster [Corynebacterium sp. TAE3-ERU30]|uniref:heterodisulfide reductase-related iron-sulfur binding cluster n=1 Tax=Corynebacterium sp. TAE3-ERU30 TaxID=2849496 RepID=UPI001C4786C9|nr:heterodisulfide reductase-related iron-sulfur binding cluster [Corynebacterium sp. TAE3-ERU30]MBV7282494.1 4Fe-4S dicluster domain-containing protein [Corynebacterium sp. TAE3-ERU30]
MTTLLGIAGVVLSLPAWAVFLHGCWRIVRFVSRGTPTTTRTDRPFSRAFQVLRKVFGHGEMMPKPAVAIAHWLVMVGFLFGVVVWFEAYIQTFNPAGGWPWLHELRVYRLLEEVLGLGTVVGILFLFITRLRVGRANRVDRFYGSNATAAHFVEAVVFLEGLGILLVKAGAIATYGGYSPWTDWVTGPLSQLLPAAPLMVSGFALFKLLTGMTWLIVVGRNLHWGVSWHRILAFFNLFLTRNYDGSPSLGALSPLMDGPRPLRLADLEQSEPASLGTGTVGDASWKMLLDSATCTECGRCQAVCPAWNTEKPLSPKLLMMSLRDAALHADLTPEDSHDGVDVLKLVGANQAVTEDVLWSCTNCGACVEQCPVDIEHIDHVANLRRYQVLEESAFPSELTGLFKNLENKGNPWGRNSRDRRAWIERARKDGIEVPIFGEDVADFSDTEYLLWVGCAGSLDEDGVATSRAIVELLHTAGVKFAVLAQDETCTGDPARRAGNELLFQTLAEQNVSTLNQVFDGVPPRQRKIITSCAHCFNTLRNEYPDFDGHYDVFHHTQLLNRLVREKLITPVPRGPENRRPLTYHDPCFLGRHNKVFDPPRELLASTGMELREMPRNRDDGFCCGAGGARMFMEENIGQRISDNRAAEAVATGAETIAVGCPFCNTMLGAGVKATANKQGNAPVIKDVAQLMRDSITIDGALPPARPKAFLERPTRVAAPRSATKNVPLPGPESHAAEDAGQTPAAPTPAAPTPAAPKAATPPAAQPAAPTPATPKAASPQAAAPQAAVPAPAVPKPSTPAPATPAAPRPAAPTPATPKAATPQPATPQATVPTPATPKPATPKAAVPTPATPQAAVPKAATPATPQSATPKAAAPQPATPKAAVPTPAVPKPATPAPATPKAATPQPAVPKTATPKPAAPKAATPQPAVPQPATPKAAAPAPAVPKPATPTPATPKAATPKAATPQAAVPKAATPKPATPQPAVPQPAVPAPTAPPPAVPQPMSGRDAGSDASTSAQHDDSEDGTQT